METECLRVALLCRVLLDFPVSLFGVFEQEGLEPSHFFLPHVLRADKQYNHLAYEIKQV